MPIHSIQRLSPTAVLGLWHLTETPNELWPLLPNPEAYQALTPITADTTRQAQWLAGRVLIHALASEIAAESSTELVVQNDVTGRPWLAGAAPEMAVSLSHSGVWVAAVVAQSGRAGVDIELIRDKAQRLAGKFLSAEEAAAAQTASAATPAQAFAHYTLLWSAKETLYKLAARRGIIFNQQLRLLPFGPSEFGQIDSLLTINELQTRHCICYTQPAPGYVLTYCYEPAG